MKVFNSLDMFFLLQCCLQKVVLPKALTVYNTQLIISYGKEYNVSVINAGYLLSKKFSALERVQTPAVKLRILSDMDKFVIIKKAS